MPKYINFADLTLIFTCVEELSEKPTPENLNHLSKVIDEVSSKYSSIINNQLTEGPALQEKAVSVNDGQPIYDTNFGPKIKEVENQNLGAGSLNIEVPKNDNSFQTDFIEMPRATIEIPYFQDTTNSINPAYNNSYQAQFGMQRSSTIETGQNLQTQENLGTGFDIPSLGSEVGQPDRSQISQGPILTPASPWNSPSTPTPQSLGITDNAFTGPILSGYQTVVPGSEQFFGGPATQAPNQIPISQGINNQNTTLFGDLSRAA